MEEEPLAHAIRCWEAEEENATRIAGRKTLIVSLPTALLALIGLGADGVAEMFAVVFDWNARSRGAWIAGLVGILSLAAGLVSLFVSMGLAVGIRRRRGRRRLASEKLHLPARKEILSFSRAANPEAREIAFARTVRAARILLKLNETVETRLYAATAWLVWGLVFSFLALFAYAWVASQSPVPT